MAGHACGRLTPVAMAGRELVWTCRPAFSTLEIPTQTTERGSRQRETHLAITPGATLFKTINGARTARNGSQVEGLAATDHRVNAAAGEVDMWTKLWETLDGHETGRWQWFTDHNVNAYVERQVATPCKISSGVSGCVYPGQWLFADAICAPPDMGRCITNVDKSKLDQARMSTR